MLSKALAGVLPSRAEALGLAECTDNAALMAAAEQLCLAGHGRLVSYSRKVFIPLTHLCRDVCGYCTFTKPPKAGQSAYLSREAVLDIARRGAAAGCKEALFTLGDQPEAALPPRAKRLDALGHE